VLRIELDDTLKKRNGCLRIAGVEGGASCFDQLIDGSIPRNRAGCCILDRERLIFVCRDGVNESGVFCGTRRGQFAHCEIQSAFRC